MKILYHHRTRRADAQGVHIAEMIEAFRNLGHDVREVAPALSGRAPRHGPVREPLWRRMARRIPLTMEILQLGYNLVGFVSLAAAVLRCRPDFIYERYALFNFAGVLVSRLFRIPLVLEVNSPLALEERREALLRLHRLALRSEVFICNSATRVIAVSAALASILIQNGVCPARITVLHNGIAPSRFRPMPPDERLRASLGAQDAFIFGFVGWFRHWHGLELLIEACGRSGLAASNVRLLLVGDGPATPAILEKARTLGISHAVILTGPVPHDDVPRYISLFDCAVQPAANQYCCPMKIIEYLAMGKPVIAPRQDNIGEIIEHGIEGLLFEPGNVDSLASALAAFARDGALRAALTQAAASAVARKRLFWSANAETVVSWFCSQP